MIIDSNILTDVVKKLSNSGHKQATYLGEIGPAHKRFGVFATKDDTWIDILVVDQNTGASEKFSYYNGQSVKIQNEGQQPACLFG